jgi:hypothetical protein
MKPFCSYNGYRLNIRSNVAGYYMRAARGVSKKRDREGGRGGGGVLMQASLK